MRDLALYRLLLERRFGDPDLPGLLEQAARDLSEVSRVPFFSGALDLLADKEAGVELKQHALQVLCGARGLLAESAFLEALSDPALVPFAVEGLRDAAEEQPSRWIHVAFHPNEEVRRCGYSADRPSGTAIFDLAVLCDPVARPAVIEQIRRKGAHKVMDVQAWPTLVASIRAGHFPSDLTGEILRDTASLLGSAIPVLRRRSEPAVDAFLEAVLAPHRPAPLSPEADPDSDDLDVVLLQLQPSLTLDNPTLVATVLMALNTCRTRAAAAAWHAILSVPSPSPALTAVAVLFDARTVASPHLPKALVRQAFLTVRDVPYSLEPSILQELAEKGAFDHPDGGLDLGLANVVFARAPDGFALLLKHFGLAAVADALAKRTDESVAIVLHPSPLSESSLRELVDAIGGLASPIGQSLLAAFLEHAPLRHVPLVTKLHDFREALPTAALGIQSETRRRELAKAIAGGGERAASGASSEPERRENTAAEHGGQTLEDIVVPLLSFPDGAFELGRALLIELAIPAPTESFVAQLIGLGTAHLLAVVAGISGALGFPIGKELALAYALIHHSDPALKAWAEGRIPREVEAPSKRPRQGVAYRPIPTPPSAQDCILLLGSADPVEATDAVFARLGALSQTLIDQIDRGMIQAFGTRPNDPLSPLGHAWLWRWDAHALAHLDLLLASHDTLAKGLAARATLKSSILREASFGAISSGLAILSARDKARFRSLATEDLAPQLIELLGSPGAQQVEAQQIAEMLVLLCEKADVDTARIVGQVRSKLPDLDQNVRDRLSRIVDSSGLLTAKKPVAAALPEDEVLAIERAIRVLRTAPLAEVARALDDPRSPIIEEAVLLMAAHGESGRARLADRLERDATVVGESVVLRAVVATIPLWDRGPALERVKRIANSDRSRSPVVFRVSLALSARGEDDAKDFANRALGVASKSPAGEGERAASEASSEPKRRETTASETGWFERADFDRLVQHTGDALLVALSLAASPHPYAYLPALEILLAAPNSPDVCASLRAFLEQGTQRMGGLRRSAAKRLADHGDLSGLPVILPRGLEDQDGLSLEHTSSEELRAAVRSLLAAGSSIAKESTLMKALEKLPRDHAATGFAEVLAHAATDNARVAASSALSRFESRASKLFVVARTFAWGARLARKLLGKSVRIRITGSRKLGFTRGDSNEVFVSPVPLFSGDPNGRDVVEGLILHELGHHKYHGGAGQAVWDEAKTLGIHGLFNLVADEHLERNLRAVDASYGDRLKRLASYAFHRTTREVPVFGLVRSLGPRAFDVLTKAELGLARDPDKVRLESGQLLFGMERAALSFARFARGLRMGLGNRHEDPRVAKALSLFGNRFRHSTMAELLEIAKQLKEIFGWEADMCESSFGPHEVFEDGLLGEGGATGEGITQDEIDRVVERITDPRMLNRGSGPGGGRLAINVSEDTKYNLIKTVEQKRFDPAAHARLASQVARPASLLRRYLDELGIKSTPRNMRTSGSRIDRSRLRTMALTRDPRVLIARERAIYRDLFLAVVIDCSGSMQSRANIERAKLFAALVAGAVATLDNVDARFFGFTDRVIFDCGDARRPSVHALEASGGNNDAGALDHVARVAQASHRRAKVIIMISDGLPTECSVAALKNLVRTLTTRQRLVVAQVAVQPITEICFPHYVLLQDAETDTVVRRFGTLVARLVRGALAS